MRSMQSYYSHSLIKLLYINSVHSTSSYEFKSCEHSASLAQFAKAYSSETQYVPSSGQTDFFIVPPFICIKSIVNIKISVIFIFNKIY